LEILVGNILDRLDISINEYPIEKITRAVNRGVSRLFLTALSADRNVQVDDFNHGDYPQVDIDLVSGQRRYSILQDSNLNDILKINAVVVLDENDQPKDIKIIDIKDKGAEGIRWQDTEDQTPYVADYSAGVLDLDPAPDYNKTDGLRVYVQREPELFTSSDTTKELGFATQHVEYLINYACEIWSLSKDKERYTAFKELRMEIEESVIEFYSERDATDNDVMLVGDIDPF
jgi:hypothetical protein